MSTQFGRTTWENVMRGVSGWRRAAVVVLAVGAMAWWNSSARGVAIVSIGNDTASPDGSYLNAQNIASTLAFTNVTVSAATSIDVVDPIDISNSVFGPAFGNLILNAPTLNLNHNMVMGAGQVGLGSVTTVNLTGEISRNSAQPGTLTFFNTGTVTQVNVLANTASIQQAINLSSTTSPPVINLTTGQYNENVTVGKALTLNSSVAQVNNGQLQILSGVTATITGTSFSNASGGTVKGSGTVNVSGLTGGFTSHGVVAPGASPGILSFTGDYNQANDGDFEVEVGGTTVGTQYDRLAVSGTANLAGAIHVSLIGGFVPSASDTFTILTAGTRAGTFNNVLSTVTVNGGVFDLSYTPTSVTLSNFSVPEPGAAGLAFASVAASALRRRRRVKQPQ